MKNKRFLPDVLNKPRKLIVVIAIVLLLVVFGVGGYFLIQKRISKTFSSVVNRTDTKVAFRNGGDLFVGGDLWTMNLDGSNKKQITSTKTIESVYDWSPDNKLIAVTFKETPFNEKNEPGKQKWSLGVVDIKSGSILKLNDEFIFEPFGVSWLTNDLLVFSNGKQIETISASSKQRKVLIKKDLSNKDNTHIGFSVSPDRVWISYYYGGEGEGDLPQVDNNTYLFNVSSGVSKVLFNKGLFIGWRGNKILYQPNIDNSIWEINFNGGGKKQLLNIGEGDLMRLTVSLDGSKLLYLVRDYINKPFSSKLYVYDFITGQSKEIKKGEPDWIQDPLFSDDGQYVSYYHGDYQLHVYKLDTGKDSIICDKIPSGCRNAKWSN